MSDNTIYYRLIILGVLLYLSGVFSSSETALTAMNVGRINRLKEDNKDGADRLLRLKKKLNNIIATILIGNNIVNIAATAILTQLVSDYYGRNSSTIIATVLMTILILIFGEITPKTYAAQYPEKVALKVGRPLEILSFLFKPILVILETITNTAIKMLGGKIINNAPFVTEEEIRSLVDVGEEEGILQLQAKEMINRVFEIDDLEVADVMVPRIDIIAISEDSTLEKSLELMIKYGHSRIPVYKDSIDNIIGLLYAKDILPFAYLEKEEIKKRSINSLIRPAYYVPETKKVNVLLKELQIKKIHMAIVLDEYGGTEGLITIEDILEEIVGDILDEYDNEIDMVEKINDNLYLVKADVSLEEINELFDEDLPEEDFDSLGGFVFSALGRLPIQGDKISYGELNFVVNSVSKRRIKQIEIKREKNNQV